MQPHKHLHIMHMICSEVLYRSATVVDLHKQSNNATELVTLRPRPRLYEHNPPANMNTLFLDALFPDPYDSSSPSTPKAEANFTGNPFALPDLYPPSILGTSTRASPREANIFDVVDHKGCVTYGHNQHIVKKQRLTYQQDSVKFVPKTAEGGDGGDSLWRTLEAGLKGGAAGGGGGGVGAGGSLFSLPEEFRSGFGDLWGVSHLTVGSGKMGEEVVGKSNARPEDGHEDTGVSEEDISDDEEVEGGSDYEGDLWLDPSVAIPLEKVVMPAHAYSAAV